MEQQQTMVFESFEGILKNGLIGQRVGKVKSYKNGGSIICLSIFSQYSVTKAAVVK